MALSEASLREATKRAWDEVAEAIKKSSFSTQILVAAEAEQEATRLALVEESEHFQWFQSEMSKRHKEMLSAHKIRF